MLSELSCHILVLERISGEEFVCQGVFMRFVYLNSLCCPWSHLSHVSGHTLIERDRGSGYIVALQTILGEKIPQVESSRTKKAPKTSPEKGAIA